MIKMLTEKAENNCYFVSIANLAILVFCFLIIVFIDFWRMQAHDIIVADCDINQGRWRVWLTS